MKGTLKICSRGHKFYKSSDCPVCPKCWPGRYKDKAQSDFPKLSAPALRALKSAKIKNMRALTKWSDADLISLHGMGPKAVVILRKALKSKK